MTPAGMVLGVEPQTIFTLPAIDRWWLVHPDADDEAAVRALLEDPDWIGEILDGVKMVTDWSGCGMDEYVQIRIVPPPSKAEEAAIEKWVASRQPTQCPTRKASGPAWRQEARRHGAVVRPGGWSPGPDLPEAAD